MRRRYFVGGGGRVFRIGGSGALRSERLAAAAAFSGVVSCLNCL